MSYFSGVFAFAVGISLVMISPSSSAQSKGKIEKDLLNIQEQWAAARVARDVPYLERL